ncbi:uncharacterized protein LOC118749343 [Rhagoletis pomonella]|uniref:uncharacterized protein LOC118749343 n=1 Tax=Rhagoletis pomonella TaxID=28610 RepID=UPI001781C012|nr:uncharacterized protein LOC118749343 [Rhagoletis pomonella]
MQREIESVIEYDDKAVTILAELGYVLCTYFKPTKVNLPNSENAGQNGESGHQGIKLKAFELKKFDGKLENWLPFWDQFKLAVHENRKLSTAAKFNFLSESLIGKAATTTAGFTSSDQCYNDAIALLQEEYGNSEKLVENFLQKLMNLKLVQSSSDVHGLRQLYNQVSAIMRSLTALQIPSSNYEVMVKSVLLKCLSAAMRIQFHRSAGRGSLSSTLLNSTADSSQNCGSSDAELKTLLDFIRVELEALEKWLLSKREYNRHEDRERKGGHVKARTATGLFTSSSDKQQQCVFCKKNNHYTKNCKSNLSAEQRKLANWDDEIIYYGCTMYQNFMH